MKPVVRFSDVLSLTKVGFPTYVKPIDHQSPLVSNTTWAITSKVIRITVQDKHIVEFETMNTIYKRDNEAPPPSQNCH